MQRRDRLDDAHGLDRGAQEHVRARADRALARQLANDRDQDVRADLRRQLPGGEDVEPISRRAEVEVVNGAPSGDQAQAEACEVLLRVDRRSARARRPRATALTCGASAAVLPVPGAPSSIQPLRRSTRMDPDRPVLVAHQSVRRVTADRARRAYLPRGDAAQRNALQSQRRQMPQRGDLRAREQRRSTTRGRAAAGREPSATHTTGAAHA